MNFILIRNLLIHVTIVRFIFVIRVTLQNILVCHFYWYIKLRSSNKSKRNGNTNGRRKYNIETSNFSATNKNNGIFFKRKAVVLNFSGNTT